MVLITPAVEGTRAALKGCHKYGVKRIVVTSSIVSIYKPTDKKKTEYSREDWTDTSRKDVTAYEKSKTLAERAAWDFFSQPPSR